MIVDDETLVEEYNNLGSANKISEKLGIPGSTISCRLKKLGVLKKWEKDIDNKELSDSYIKLQSVRKVAELFNISRETVRYKLKKLGILNKPLEKYLCSNEDLFKQDAASSFYWSGFIAADGCVKLHSHKYKQLSIGLAEKDEKHLYKFKEIIGYNGPIRQKEDLAECHSSEICIRSDKIFDDLARFNIVPRKSLILTFPEWLINNSNINHFMRGYNDGDGSFYISRPKNERTVKQLYFSLRGTKEFLEVYSQILSKQCDIDYKKPRANSGIYTLEYGGNRKVCKIRDFLYNNSNEQIRLDRKYDLAFSEQFTALPEDFKFSPVIATNIETGQEISFKSIKDAKAAGFTGPSISACCVGKYKSHKGYTWKYIQET